MQKEVLFQSDERDKGKSFGPGIISIQSLYNWLQKKKIGGMLCTAWDDKSPHMENYWRGFIAAAVDIVGLRKAGHLMNMMKHGYKRIRTIGTGL